MGLAEAIARCPGENGRKLKSDLNPMGVADAARLVAVGSDPSAARAGARAEEDMPMSAYRRSGGTLVPLTEVRLKLGFSGLEISGALG
jgi:hypothetical protein